MKYKIRFFILTLILIIAISFLIPTVLYAELRQFWVDTSHWETTSKWVEEGHWKTNLGRRWVDTSSRVDQGYWENYTETVWVDTSHWVEKGYWQNYTYMKWVASGYYAYRYVRRWVDTSHWEFRSRVVTRWVPYNKTDYYGPHINQWFTGGGFHLLRKEVYLGYMEGTIGGRRYRYHKYKLTLYNTRTRRETFFYGYKRVYRYVLETRREIDRVWVNEGHWEIVRERYWVDTSHWETRTGRRWVDISYWVEDGYYETRTGRRWVDTSYLVPQGYWENYTETVWVDTSHWEYNDEWVEEGYWVEADLNLEGRVLHTLQWDRNRISYNLSKTGTEDKPRGYEVFFNGEKFILNAYATGDFEPDSVHVDFLNTEFETDLTYSGNHKWEGYIWDESFINFIDRDCVFKFTAIYENGVTLEEDVEVYIVRDEYWRLHRGF